MVKEFDVNADATGQILTSLLAANNFATISAIEVFSGATRVQGIECGNTSFGEISINASTLTNNGTIRVKNGMTLSVTNFSSNQGTRLDKEKVPGLFFWQIGVSKDVRLRRRKPEKGSE